MYKYQGYMLVLVGFGVGGFGVLVGIGVGVKSFLLLGLWLGFFWLFFLCACFFVEGFEFFGDFHGAFFCVLEHGFEVFGFDGFG